MLVFIIFIFYSRRAESEGDEDEELDDDELDEILDDSDLHVDFIDDDEE